jgi:glycosyltransferase involved in cell wall biosynthesis
MLRLVRKGYDMTLFTSQFPNGLQNENIDGVNIVRCGSKYSVYNKGKDYYRKNNEYYDLFIDGINTRPFLTPKFVKEKPILALFYQLAAEIWLYETPFPLNYIGHYYLEKKWLSAYRGIPTITLSDSSKQDLEAIGFKKIFIVPIGLNVIPISEVPQKESNPTIVFIGRLKKHKLPHHAIEAFLLIKKHIPSARLWVVGGGPIQNELENKFNDKDIIFYGHIKEELKYELLRKAHLILVPSIREGWGLVVTESNAMGTPAVAYNVPGLRDSVMDGETGILVKDNSPESLAHSTITLLKDRDLLTRYSKKALGFSKQFSWDTSANEFEKIINNVI